MISERIAKGRDCGAGRHQWYYKGGDDFACYHCERLADGNPFTGEEWARIRSIALINDALMMLKSQRADDELQELIGPNLVEVQEHLETLASSRSVSLRP